MSKKYLSKKKPSVDIIMPNYNKGLFLSEAINSVIKQSYHNWKLFVIDDASQDNSKIILKKYKKIVSLQLHDHMYSCQLIDNQKILITNSKGQRLSSELSSTSENLNAAQKVFAKKILTFAQLALGKAA